MSQWIDLLLIVFAAYAGWLIGTSNERTRQSRQRFEFMGSDTYKQLTTSARLGALATLDYLRER